MDFNNNKEVAPGDQQNHPLFNPDIMENVLVFCKGHRDQNDNRTFPSLRLVCKIWDVEVCKFLRRETEMPLPRILSPYPEGLGWKWNRSLKTPGYQYRAPYPETPIFESVKITAEACKVIKDPKVIRWFKVMGGQVKSFHYSSPLNCSHQNVFLGNVLHSWCPNLETLHLSGIQCFSSLLYICEGKEEGDREFNGALNCAKLKHLIISVDSEDPKGQFLECHHKTDYGFLQNRREHIFAATWVHNCFLNLIHIFPENKVIEKHAKIFHELVGNAVEKGEVGPIFLNDKFKVLFEELGIIWHRFGITDWGILGLILRVAPLQKVVIRKLVNLEQCRNLMIFLLYQPSKLRSTLKHLEFQNNVSVGKSLLCSKTLSMFKCPLKILRLDNLLPLENWMGCIYDLLKRCADTLNTLEIGIARAADEDGGGEAEEVELLKFEIPALPNLEKFVHRNLSRLPLEGNGFLRNCPNLKFCRFLDKNNLERGYLGRWALTNLFCDELVNCTDNELGHPLRELEIFGGNLRFGNIEGLGAGLRNLVKVDIEVEGWAEFKCFLGWMGGKCGKLESVRISVASKYGGDADGGDRWNQLISEDIHKIESVKFLDLVFRGKEVKLGLDAFKKGFGELKKLTSLKITKFWVETKDWVGIRKFIGHIQFVGFLKMHWYSQGDNWVGERLCIM